MLCPNCGRELSDFTRICPDCGTVLRETGRRGAVRERTTHRVEVARPEENAASHGRTTQTAPSAPCEPYRDGASRVRPNVQSTVQPGEGPSQRVGARRASAPPRSEGMVGGAAPVTPGRVVRVRHAPKREKALLQGKPAKPSVKLNRQRVRVWPIVISVTLVLLAVVTGSLLLLLKTNGGQRQLARWGYDVSASAYMMLGGEYLDSGYVTQAIAAYQTAYEKEPDSVQAALELGSAYEIDGQREAALEIYQHLMDELAPQHVEAYNRVIRIYRDQGYNAEAVALMRTALEKTGSSTFETMIREFTPDPPAFTIVSGNADASNTSGRYQEETVVKIAADTENAQIFFTLGEEENPLETGTLFGEDDILVFNEDDTRLYTEDAQGNRTEKQVYATEGKVTVRAVTVNANGVASEVETASYNVVVPTPDAPKATLQSGTYSKSYKVGIRAGEDIVEIHYTIDGTPATLQSPLYTEPIQLPIGRTTLRAIALSENGKVSYEMQVSYKVEGNLKKMFSSADTFKNLELMSTTYDSFVKKYGAPSNYVAIEGDGTGKSYEGTWDWGVARFVEKSEGKKPVLYYLETASTAMTGPRSTKIGMAIDDVCAKFRDLGSYPNEDGERTLYNYSDSSVQLNTQFGTYRKAADGTYALHYYYPTKDNAFVELSYYQDTDGNVSRIVWTRYRSEV